MKIFIYILFFWFASCSDEEKKSSFKVEDINFTDSLSVTPIFFELNGTWERYKVEQAKERKDSLENNSYNILIQDSIFFYRVGDKIKYSDTLVHVTACRYTFKSRYYDMLNYYLPKEDTIPYIVINRFNFDGDVEFFRKRSRGSDF